MSEAVTVPSFMMTLILFKESLARDKPHRHVANTDTGSSIVNF